jgi:hypothetical protein
MVTVRMSSHGITVTVTVTVTVSVRVMVYNGTVLMDVAVLSPCVHAMHGPRLRKIIPPRIESIERIELRCQCPGSG